MRPLAAAIGLMGAMLALAGGLAWLIAAANPAPPAIGGPFRLTAGNGETVTERSFPGKYLLIYFGYTGCRDVCPTTLTSMAAAFDALGPKAARVQPVFVTVDPARDTPAIVSRYAASFSSHLIGLTGTAAQIRTMTGEYRVAVDSRADGRGGYDVDHDSVIYLMDRHGRFLAPIQADAPPALMARSIAGYLR